MSNVFQNLQLQRIANAIEDGAVSGSITIDVTGAGDMQGATASTAGAHGLVPAPAAGDEDKVLSGAGTWINAGTVGELGDLEDVTITSPTSGESLKYDGKKWVNGNVTADLPDFIEETSGSIVTVEAAERPAKSLKVAINPIQAGSGDPSPDNIRPISGWSACNVFVSPTQNAEDGTTYTIEFKDGDNPLTVYGGTLDVVNGVLTVNRFGFSLTDLNWTQNAYYDMVYNGYKESVIGGRMVQFDWNNACLCSSYKGVKSNEMVNNTIALANAISGDDETKKRIYVRDERFNRDVAGFVQEIITNPVTVVLPLATPVTYQLTPTEVQMLLGTNNIWADTGEVKELKYIPQTYDDILKEVSSGIGTTYTVISDTTQTTNTWANPIKISCKPLDYDVIIFDISNSGGDNFYCITFPHTLPLDSGDGQSARWYALSNNFKCFPARFSDGMGVFTSTDVTLNANKVTGIKFGGIL